MNIEDKHKKIEFNTERDFSDAFGTAFAFMRQNFKKLFLTLLYLAGPFLLISALLNAVYTQTAFDMQSLMTGGGAPLQMFTPVYFLTILFTLVSGLVFMAITFEYIVLYEEFGYDGFQISDVWKRFKQDIGRIVGAFFGLILVGIIVAIILGIIILVLSIIGPAGGVIMGLLAFVGLLIFGLPIGFVFTIVYLIIIKERIGFWAALTKARAVLKNNFWITWVIMFLAYLIVSILTVITSLPLSIVTGLSAFNGLNGGGGDFSILLVILNVFSVFAINLAVNVFATPGTPSIKTCPSAKIATSNKSIILL
jgi:hypothetical protein